MTRQRLLAMTHDYSSSGAPIVLLEMLSGLVADYDLLLVGPTDGATRQAFQSAGVKSLVVPNILFDPPAIGNLLLNHDLLLANTIQGFVAVHVANQLKKPSLWYIHEGQVGVQFVNLSPFVPSAFAYADCVGYAGEFQRALYAQWRGNKRTEILRYGTQNQDHAERPVARSPLQVLLLGSFEFRKGQDVALSAFRLLKDHDLVLNMVGPINNRGYFEGVMDHFQDVAHARYLPEVPKEKARALIRASDIVIVPSRDEATPLVILEAMALGKPVIASRICGMPEMITDGQTGLLFESENAEQLAELILQLAGKLELRHELGINARQWQREHWTLELSRQRFHEVVASLSSL